MTDWQALISQAAVELFTRTGRGARFRLKRPELVQLAVAVAGTDAEQVRRSLTMLETGFTGVRCLVWCEPLQRQVVVDEWVEP